LIITGAGFVDSISFVGAGVGTLVGAFVGAGAGAGSGVGVAIGFGVGLPVDSVHACGDIELTQ